MAKKQAVIAAYVKGEVEKAHDTDGPST